MNEHDLKMLLDDVAIKYQDLLEDYNNGETWTENKIKEYKSQFPNVWNSAAARRFVYKTKKKFEDIRMKQQ